MNFQTCWRRELCTYFYYGVLILELDAWKLERRCYLYPQRKFSLAAASPGRIATGSGTQSSVIVLPAMLETFVVLL